jgi:hypothetical protein
LGTFGNSISWVSRPTPHSRHNRAGLIYVDPEDPYKCSAVRNNGKWLDPPDREPDHKPFQLWSPPGCILHDYSAPDIANCNGEGKILFVGDTGTRQIFWATARKIESDRWVFKEQSKVDNHSDIEYSNKGAHLKFLWDPWLNSSALHNELKKLSDPLETDSPSTKAEAGTGPGREVGSRKPVAIFIGGGLWHARRFQTSSFDHFKASVDSITTIAEKTSIAADWDSLSQYNKDGIGNQVFFAPVIEPQYDRLSPAREITIVPEKINAMNHYLQQKSVHHGLNVLWSYTNMTKGQSEAYGESGLHVVENVANRMADVFLNLRCNAKAAQQPGPLDRTCCIAYRPITWMQMLIIAVTIGVLGLKIFRAARGAPASSVRSKPDESVARQRSSSMSISTTASVAAASLVLLFSALYCFLTDRTHTFDKFSEHFSKFEFRILLGLAVVPCLFTIKGAQPLRSRRRSPSIRGFQPDNTFLPIEQSDEFKGWMQVYILVQSYVGAYNLLTFHEVLRILFALYLFLSAYGHSMYLLQKKDYTLHRVASVLLRLNILPVLLAFMMDRPYASYHFAPLVSFWFLVTFATLKLANHRNELLGFLIAKVFLAAVAASLFIHLRGILEAPITVLQLVLRMDLNVQEWRFHLGTDKYIVFAGMLVAIIHVRVLAILNRPQHQSHIFAEMIAEYFVFFQCFFILAALVLSPVFWIVSQSHTNKADYNFWMPFLSWMPVLSLVLLRNATRILRTYHIAAFAWLGRMSLTLYLLSQHIWLAGDGSALLRVGFRGGDGSLFGDRWRDIAVLTPIFVWAAWKVNAATQILTAAILGRLFKS